MSAELGELQAAVRNLALDASRDVALARALQPLVSGGQRDPDELDAAWDRAANSFHVLAAYCDQRRTRRTGTARQVALGWSDEREQLESIDDRLALAEAELLLAVHRQLGGRVDADRAAAALERVREARAELGKLAEALR